MVPHEVKRLLVLCGIAASLVAADATKSAAPPVFLTYATVPGPGTSAGGLCLARTDGSRRVRLTRGREDRAASWSPGGRYVAFARPVGREVRIVIADTRGRTVRSFGSAALNTEPAWSPDGSRIAYVAGAQKSRIVVASRQGRTLATLPTGAASATRPAWSPDGRRIAYTERLDVDADQQASPRRIFAINADGTGRSLLASNAGEPTWSPDGSRIAYVAYESRFAETGHVAVAKADGSGARRLSAASEAESRPAWSPRGAVIAFARGSGAGNVIVVAKSDGSSERVAVRSRSYGALDPAWRRPVVLPRARRPACS
jgi:TolB protein